MPAGFVTVARVEDLPPGTIAAVEADGETIALANVEGSFYATQGACLHLKGPLGDGRLEGPVLTCPWHGWQYDVRTGKNEFDRALELRTYEVRVEDGEVKVAVG
ncbi:MAG TPA: Rieske 2Fe-2S domain-containing protein [Gaiellaceae bacterium]|jgi:nitrite reductase/ring-hydroxylating ferredoxin subunit|nr:Rieske 2Fe-2S domain-containing protein [Gaiellaceae bacterium]